MILYYIGRQAEFKEKVKEIFASMDQSIRFVEDDELNQDIEELLKTENGHECEGERDAFLFLDDLSQEDIQKMNQMFEEKKIDIPRKACRTEHNIKWRMLDLMEEVNREYAYFQLRDELYDLVIHPDEKRLEKDSDYMTTMSMAYSLLQNENTEAELLELAIQTIKNMSDL